MKKPELIASLAVMAIVIIGLVVVSPIYRFTQTETAKVVEPDRVHTSDTGEICHVWYDIPNVFVACSDGSRAVVNMLQPQQDMRTF